MASSSLICTQSVKYWSISTNNFSRSPKSYHHFVAAVLFVFLLFSSLLICLSICCGCLQYHICTLAHQFNNNTVVHLLLLLSLRSPPRSPGCLLLSLIMWWCWWYELIGCGCWCFVGRWWWWWWAVRWCLCVLALEKPKDDVVEHCTYSVDDHRMYDSWLAAVKSVYNKFIDILPWDAFNILWNYKRSQVTKLFLGHFRTYNRYKYL